MNIEQAIQSALPTYTEMCWKEISEDPHDWTRKQRNDFKNDVKGYLSGFNRAEMEVECTERAAPEYQPAMIETQEIDYVFTAENNETIYQAMQVARGIESEDAEHAKNDFAGRVQDCRA